MWTDLRLSTLRICLGFDLQIEILIEISIVNADFNFDLDYDCDALKISCNAVSR